jgi:hypothetical protein
MKKLTEKEVIKLLREEWTKKLESFLPEKSKSEKKEKTDTDLSVEFPLKGEKEIVISPELKVKSKKGVRQGLLYTVSDVNPADKTITLTHYKEDGAVNTTITFDEFVKEFERQ